MVLHHHHRCRHHHHHHHCWHHHHRVCLLLPSNALAAVLGSGMNMDPSSTTWVSSKNRWLYILNLTLNPVLNTKQPKSEPLNSTWRLNGSYMWGYKFRNYPYITTMNLESKYAANSEAQTLNSEPLCAGGAAALRYVSSLRL